MTKAYSPFNSLFNNLKSFYNNLNKGKIIEQSEDKLVMLYFNYKSL